MGLSFFYLGLVLVSLSDLFAIKGRCKKVHGATELHTARGGGKLMHGVSIDSESSMLKAASKSLNISQSDVISPPGTVLRVKCPGKCITPNNERFVKVIEHPDRVESEAIIGTPPVCRTHCSKDETEILTPLKAECLSQRGVCCCPKISVADGDRAIVALFNVDLRKRAGGIMPTIQSILRTQSEVAMPPRRLSKQELRLRELQEENSEIPTKKIDGIVHDVIEKIRDVMNSVLHLNPQMVVDGLYQVLDIMMKNKKALTWPPRRFLYQGLPATPEEFSGKEIVPAFWSRRPSGVPEVITIQIDSSDLRPRANSPYRIRHPRNKYYWALSDAKQSELMQHFEAGAPMTILQKDELECEGSLLQVIMEKDADFGEDPKPANKQVFLAASWGSRSIDLYLSRFPIKMLITSSQSRPAFDAMFNAQNLQHIFGYLSDRIGPGDTYGLIRNAVFGRGPDIEDSEEVDIRLDGKHKFAFNPVSELDKMGNVIPLTVEQTCLGTDIADAFTSFFQLPPDEPKQQALFDAMMGRLSLPVTKAIWDVVSITFAAQAAIQEPRRYITILCRDPRKQATWSSLEAKILQDSLDSKDRRYFHTAEQRLFWYLDEETLGELNKAWPNALSMWNINATASPHKASVGRAKSFALEGKLPSGDMEYMETMSKGRRPRAG